MEPVSLIHITPELPPTIGGIADYTSILTRRLVEVSDGRIDPVLVRAGWKVERRPDVEFPLEDLGGVCSAGRLSERIKELAARSENRSVVLLEYSGYGYAKRGAPVWLVQGLKQVCAEGKIPLVTMCHELYASGPPWSSAFWVSPMQRYVAAQLARLSSAVVTNREQSAEWLKKYIKNGTSLQMQPVFSNVGEPDTVPPFEGREPFAVVFGGRAMKEQLYSTINSATKKCLVKLGIERIIDIGNDEHNFQEVGSIRIEKKGIQSPKKISMYMKNAKIGLLYYPLDYLTKSGIWGCYAAHSVPTIIFSPLTSANMNKRMIFIHPDDENVSPLSNDILKKVSKNAFEWYENVHSRQSAEKFKELIVNTLN